MHSRIALILNEILPRTTRATLAMAGLLAGVLLAVAVLSGGAARAQSIARPGPEAAPQAVPGFWDPRRRPGPAAAPARPRPVPPHGDPVPDRNRLSAVQLHRPRRQSRRFQRRSGPAALRRDQGHLHHPDAAVRDAARRDREQPGRRHYRLARGNAAD